MSMYHYDRMKAVKYADLWWNKRNPVYPVFEVDCTNYISQCLYAGGMEMSGYPDKLKGWWFRKPSWSLSWSVAHSMYWYLKQRTGNGVTELATADELQLGDVICYDFEGDDTFNHTTIVTAKDSYGSPLVNAHTDNSYHRPWVYNDSLAWTPNINYAFFHIEGD